MLGGGRHIPVCECPQRPGVSEAAVNHSVWVLGPELGSSERAVLALNTEPALHTGEMSPLARQ